jgi:hypothetical protein
MFLLKSIILEWADKILVSSAKIIGAEVYLLSWVSHLYIDDKVDVQKQNLMGLNT